MEHQISAPCHQVLDAWDKQSPKGEQCGATEKRPPQIQTEMEAVREELTKQQTLNEGLQIAVGSLARDKSALEEAVQRSTEKVEELESDKKKWKGLHKNAKLRLHRTEKDLKSSLDLNLEKVETLTDDLSHQVKLRKKLKKQIEAQETTLSKRQAETERLQDAFAEQLVALNGAKAASAALSQMCDVLENKVDGLRSANAIQIALNEDLENQCAAQEDDLAALVDEFDALKAKCKGLEETVEETAEEGARLQRANAKSCKRIGFFGDELLNGRAKELTLVVTVNDFAGFFTRTSSENVEHLKVLIEVVPPEKNLIRQLLGFTLETEEKIKIMADVLKQHGRIIRDRG